MGIEELIRTLSSGMRMEAPIHCPDNMYVRYCDEASPTFGHANANFSVFTDGIDHFS